MARIERFEDIEAWKEARRLSADTYAVTRSRPFRADASLQDQLRRASVSIMSNIAEGFDSGSGPKLCTTNLKPITDNTSHRKRG